MQQCGAFSIQYQEEEFSVQQAGSPLGLLGGALWSIEAPEVCRAFSAFSVVFNIQPPEH